MRQMKRPATQNCIYSPGIAHSNRMKVGSLKRVESQARMELDSVPLTQLGQQFKGLMDSVISEFKQLHISQSTIRKLENMHRQCVISGSQLVNSTTNATSDEFFRNWDILVKEYTDYLQISPIVRSQDFLGVK